MQDPLDNYVYLNAGTLGAIKSFRESAKVAHDLTDSEEVKQHLNNIYTGLQALANGLNISARHQLLGSTPVSQTAPEAPELDTEPIINL